MTNPTVRVLSEPGESWVVELDRERHELLLNADQIGNADQITVTGAELVLFLERRPGASDEELTTVAVAAARAAVSS